MISPNIRDGMSHIAAFEAVRFSVWAKLVGYKHTEAATILLQHMARIQAAMQLALYGHTAGERADGREYITVAVGEARQYVRGVLRPIIDLMQGTVAQNLIGAIGSLERLALNAACPPGAPPDVHPAQTPPPNGTHRSVRNSNAR